MARLVNRNFDLNQMDEARRIAALRKLFPERQYASALGKTANCQTLVSQTLTRGEVPVVLALRLFLPESWTRERARLERAGVPTEYRTARTKPELALADGHHQVAYRHQGKAQGAFCCRFACESPTDHRSGSGTRGSRGLLAKLCAMGDSWKC